LQRHRKNTFLTRAEKGIHFTTHLHSHLRAAYAAYVSDATYATYAVHDGRPAGLFLTQYVFKMLQAFKYYIGIRLKKTFFCFQCHPSPHCGFSCGICGRTRGQVSAFISSITKVVPLLRFVEEISYSPLHFIAYQYGFFTPPAALRSGT
jgi:hypothetical protein